MRRFSSRGVAKYGEPFLELCRTCEADCKQASVVKACQFSQMVLKGMFISQLYILFLYFDRCRGIA